MNDKQHFPILIPERVEFIKKTESKKCVFDSLTDLLVKNQSQVTKNQVFDALVAREKLGDTYIGNGIALPRANIEITHPRAELLAIKKGISLSAADKKPIQLFLGILLPNNNDKDYSVLLTDFYKKILLEEDFKSLIKSGNKDKAADLFDKLLTGSK